MTETFDITEAFNRVGHALMLGTRFRREDVAALHAAVSAMPDLGPLTAARKRCITTPFGSDYQLALTAFLGEAIKLADAAIEKES